MSATVDKVPTQLQCDGACEVHTGTPRRVSVQGWGKFVYCDSAVKEDERRGLVVSDSVEEDQLPQLPDNADVSGG